MHTNIDTYISVAQAQADERWTELGQRLGRAQAALTTLAEDAGTVDNRERLEIKVDAVKQALADWACINDRDEGDRVAPLRAVLTCRKEAARSDGEVSGYSLALDYLRSA